MKVLFLLLITMLFVGCTHGNVDDDLSTQPVTNNPNIVPKTGQMPY